ncbi:MAG: hypothetical protein Q9187_004542 [Circinaria calcarea]
MAASSNPVHLDGTTLEGGGQLLRVALTLSSLTGVPIHVTDIRGKRAPKSGKGEAGGLKSSHLAGVEWLARATGAETAGMAVKSRDLLFRPLTAPEVDSPLASTTDAGKFPGIKDARTNESDAGVWNDIYIDGVLVRRDSHIRMSTPGSIFLVLQAILPYILLSAHSNLNLGPSVVPLRLIIAGGTNVTQSLSYEYASQVLFPMLELKLGIEPIKMTLQRRGWSMGTTSVGSVTLDITPLKPESSLPAFRFEDRGNLIKIHASIIAPNSAARATVRERVLDKVQRVFPDVEVLFPVDDDSRHPKRLYLLLVAETSNGYRLGRDWLFDRRVKEATMDEHAKDLVGKVVGDLSHELAHGGCVDEHLQDQLIVFQALSEGRAVVDSGKNNEGSLHTQTARWVVEQMLGLEFDKGSCDGIGFRAGQKVWPSGKTVPSNLAVPLVKDFGRLKV